MRIRLRHKIIYLVVGLALFVWTYSFYVLFKMKLTEKAINLKLQETLSEMTVVKEKIERQEILSDELEDVLDEFASDESHQLQIKTNFKLPKILKNKEKIREPSLKYEQLRRRVKSNIVEFYNFMKSEGNQISQNFNVKINAFIPLVYNMKMYLLNDMETLRTVDGFEKWRQLESKRLSDLVQERFEEIQNPPDCSNARKIVFKHRNECGFGCQIHHLVNSFTLAYQDGRTLLLNPKNWNYHKEGFESIFEPLSKSCEDDQSDSDLFWPDLDDSQVLRVKTTYFESNDEDRQKRPEFFPSAVPSDLAPKLLKLHGEPGAWWVGQILKYFLKYRIETQNEIDEGMKALNFQKPIVGVHIRRTDKLIREARNHSLDEYMDIVNVYYERLETTQKVDKRRVFMVTDDPMILEEIKNEKYSKYEFIMDLEATLKASKLETRYTISSFKRFLLDLHLLSVSDYLICTLSSEVCRVAYELMQTRHVDASERVHSLDFIYYYNGHKKYYFDTLIPHTAKNELAFVPEIDAKVGDILEVFTGADHHLGMTFVKNTRTEMSGKIPAFKLKRQPEIVRFSRYN